MVDSIRRRRLCESSLLLLRSPPGGLVLGVVDELTLVSEIDGSCGRCPLRAAETGVFLSRNDDGLSKG